MFVRTRGLVIICCALTLALAAGCAKFKPASMLLSPERSQVGLDGSVVISAYGMDEKGETEPLKDVKWQIIEGRGGLSATKGAFVTFKATYPQKAVIEATYGKLTARSEIEVLYEQRLERLEIDPAAWSMDEGASKEFVAIGHDQYDNPMEAELVWTLEGKEGEVVPGSDGKATFKPKVYGNYRLTAKSGPVEAFAEVIVGYTPIVSELKVSAFNADEVDGKAYVKAGTTFTAVAVGRDQYGQEMDLNVLWDLEGNGAEIELLDGSAISIRATLRGEHKLIAKQGAATAELPFKVYLLKLPFWPYYL